MSDTFGTPPGTGTGSAASAGTVHEAYSFACMNCGHGWEQSYEIAHHTDEHGHTSCVYYAGSQRVPSPLTRPSCGNCGGHLVRIMRSGRVSAARWDRLAYAKPPSGAEPDARGSGALSATGTFPVPDDVIRDHDEAHDEAGGEHDPADHPHRRPHWLTDLLAIFHRRSPGEAGDEHHDRAA